MVSSIGYCYETSRYCDVALPPVSARIKKPNENACEDTCCALVSGSACQAALFDYAASEIGSVYLARPQSTHGGGKLAVRLIGVPDSFVQSRRPYSQAHSVQANWTVPRAAFRDCYETPTRILIFRPYFASERTKLRVALRQLVDEAFRGEKFCDIHPRAVTHQSTAALLEGY